MYALLVHYSVAGDSATYGEQQDPARGDEKTYFVAYKYAQTGYKLNWIALGK